MTAKVTTSGYDVIYGAAGVGKPWVTVECHFCREVGCYGTNPGHGMTWAEACEEAAKLHDTLAAEWREQAKQEPAEI